MNYTILVFQASAAMGEILEAELSQIGYSAFWESSDGLHTAIAEPLFDEGAIRDLLIRYQDIEQVPYRKEIQEKQNWNAQWEASFEPIEVDNTCRIRAHFHKRDTRFPLEIEITPKMSFGTGHHETTRLMVRQQLELGNQFERVLDLGTGTGILAILAKKLGAKEVWGFDIESWAVENAIENAEINRTPMEIREGTVEQAAALGQSFDLVLANINRSVLERELPAYIELLKTGGTLLLSGFYQKDIPLILDCAAPLSKEKQDVEGKWACLRLKKA